MVHWFHRNVQKFTASQDFIAKELTNSGERAKILGDLKRLRMNFLNVLYNPSSTREVVVEKYNSYVNMLLGLVKAPGRHERENKEAISLI